MVPKVGAPLGVGMLGHTRGGLPFLPCLLGREVGEGRVQRARGRVVANVGGCERERDV